MTARFLAVYETPAGRATADDAARLQELAQVRSMVYTAQDASEPDQAPAAPTGS